MKANWGTQVFQPFSGRLRLLSSWNHALTVIFTTRLPIWSSPSSTDVKTARVFTNFVLFFQLYITLDVIHITCNATFEIVLGLAVSSFTPCNLCASCCDYISTRLHLMFHTIILFWILYLVPFWLNYFTLLCLDVCFYVLVSEKCKHRLGYPGHRYKMEKWSIRWSPQESQELLWQYIRYASSW